VHMFERDCSLQRRHQKVIEEAPAPGMTEDVRKAMTDAAIMAAKAVNYVGAGTVEFIVDGSGKLKKDGFWFMEMNTRLQVEHPVTEMITGLDLVELQIRVAQGEKLPKQKDIKMEGHAIEARLYAEDPANDFLPSVGKLEEFYISIFTDDATIRIDSGVEEKDIISIFYDPMIAKVICHSSLREKAITELSDSLDYSTILGIKNNSQFLNSLISNQFFKDSKISTAFINEHFNFSSPNKAGVDLIIFAITACKLIRQKGHHQKRQNPFNGKSNSPFEALDGWRANLGPICGFSLIYEGEEHVAIISEFLSDRWKVHVSGQDFIIYNDDDDTNSPFFLDNWSFRIFDDMVTLSNNGKSFQIHLNDHSGGVSNASTSNTLTAPMPEAGDPLIIMEAMKMEMTLEAPRDGRVAKVNASANALVTDGELLLSLEDAEE